MQHYDEKNQLIDTKQLKSELQNLHDVPVPTKEELETELEMAYQQANTNITAMQDINFAGIGGRLLKQVKKAVCSAVGPDSSSDEIVDAVLDALVGLIPGGFILKPLAKKLAKFIFDQGIGAFCQV